MRTVYVSAENWRHDAVRLNINQGDVFKGYLAGELAMVEYRGNGNWAVHYNTSTIPSSMLSPMEGFLHLKTISAGPTSSLKAIMDYIGTWGSSPFVMNNEGATVLEPEFSKVFILDKYARTNMYTGQSGYHSHAYSDMNAPIVEFKGHRIGVELEVEANSATQRKVITDSSSNWFVMETDASLGPHGIEFVTIPLLPKDAKSPTTWAPLVDFLSGKAKSWSTGRCGLHVHIGREILGNTPEKRSETIGKMLYLYHHGLKDNPTNVSIYGRNRAYHDMNGAVETANAVKSLGPEVFKVKNIKERVKNELTSRSRTDRYFDINIQNTNTIEFRKGRGSINVNRICAIVEYSELIALYSRKAKWEKISVDNFFEWARKRVKRTSPLSRWISSDEVCN